MTHHSSIKTSETNIIKSNKSENDVVIAMAVLIILLFAVVLFMYICQKTKKNALNAVNDINNINENEENDMESVQYEGQIDHQQTGVGFDYVPLIQNDVNGANIVDTS